MYNFEEFFNILGFTFGEAKGNIKPVELKFHNNPTLTSILSGKTFIFDSKQNSRGSFYYISIPLDKNQLLEVRNFIWNENKYDMYFSIDSKDNETLVLYYAKTNPRLPASKRFIESFRNNSSKEKLEKIKKWKFESGVFWTNYADFLGKQKKHTIDKELIEQLKLLKSELVKLIPENLKIVQALIDRTLYVKFLEDKHIINSYFYNHYFPELKINYENICYKYFLKDNNVAAINKLFSYINRLFNNYLFESPKIDEQYLTSDVTEIIYSALIRENLRTGQLSLFDFKFDVIPIEFISHIYEVFLEKSQLKEGIYYTPDKLAQLIIDKTIIKNGSVLDPACGSGMFLVLAFRKLLEFNPIKSNNVSKQIIHRCNIIKENIFGIEKREEASRLTLFSLNLEVFKDLSSNEIESYIIDKIKSKCEHNIFPLDFSENIICQNALEISENKAPHKNKNFDFIIGNPPFFKIDDSNQEMEFISNFSLTINDEIVTAKSLIGDHQISQAFIIKIKSWSHGKTRFGFVQNSSNFYNEKSINFQKFFFTQYTIEEFYDLSQVKELLFRKATEPVVVTIFSNLKPNKQSIVKYYPVEMEMFSKLFDILIIFEDKRKDLNQTDIPDKINLRDILFGNEFDQKLVRKFLKKDKLKNYLSKDKRFSSFKGIERISNKNLLEYYKLSEADKDELKRLHIKFADENYLSKVQTDYFTIPYIYQPEKSILPFSICNYYGFLNKKDVNDYNFQRQRKPFIFEGENIVVNKFGNKIKSAYVESDLYFSNLIYGIKLENKKYYHLFTAIINSDLINYYLNVMFRNRISGNFANLDTTALKSVPIPNEFDEDLVEDISEMSRKLTNNELIYQGKTEEELNALIYELYDLNILEINRIKDYFRYSKSEKITPEIQDNYKKTITQSLQIYFNNKLEIEIYPDKSFGLGLTVAAIYFIKSKKDLPTSKKMVEYAINDIVSNNNDGLTTLREISITDNCIYISKMDRAENWSVTKAFEDGQKILQRLIK